LEADFLAVYRLDLREVLGDDAPFGMRRLRALIEGLPPSAMFWRREPGWGTTEELLALNAEVTHAAVRVLLAAFSRKGASLPKPLRVPRPWDVSRRSRPKPKRRIAEADLAAYGGAVTRIAAPVANGSETG
jgi:hypothetical protein